MKRFILLTLSIFFAGFIVFLYPIVKTIKPFIPYTNYLLGVEKPINYLILLGNDTEMRANGGFAGSYTKISLSTKLTNNFELTTNNSFDFQDIYVPNGQLQGHVTPPDPIQQAFGHGTWELANADWEPDFPTAAKDLRWFLEKGKEINPDILGIVNLTTIKKVLDVVGDFSVPEYQAKITPENLYLFLQGKTEVGFFPGSTQKKDTLTAVGTAMIKKLKILPISKKIKIAKILYEDLSNQNIVANSLNPSFQVLLVEQKFAGALSPSAYDNYALIETNLGANKANQFVTRQTTHDITFSESLDYIHHQVTIHFTNSSPEANPNPPLYYGGDYIGYLRVYIPTLAKDISLVRTPVGSPPIPDSSPITPEDAGTSPSNSNNNSDFTISLNPLSTIITTEQILDNNIDKSKPKTNNPEPIISPKFGFTEIGFWHTTHAGRESTINLSYKLPLPACHSNLYEKISNSETFPCNYSFAILKQHGLVSSPQTVNLFGKTYTTRLESEFFLPR